MHTVVAAAPMLRPALMASQLVSLRAGSVTTAFATVASVESTTTAIENIGQWRRASAAPQSGFTVVTSSGQIADATARGDVSVVLHLQGADPVAGSLDLLEVFLSAGVRVVQPTYNYRNAVGDGCFEPSDCGLSVFGKRFIDHLRESRALIDVSHVGARTARDCLERADAPVVATHSNAAALCPHPRNLSDELIRAIAGSGGVIGICAFPSFVSERPRPSLECLVDHAAYIADLVGPEHVGLGFDFAEETEADFEFYGYDPRYYPRPPWTWPEGLGSHADTQNVASELARRGFSAAEVRGVMGANFMGVLRLAWRN